MARDYSAEYEARNERAQERGWDSFYDERSDRTTAREMFGDLDRDTMVEASEFVRDFADGDYSIGDLRDIYEGFGGDADSEAFWDWVGDLYGG